jgi:MFS family permease
MATASVANTGTDGFALPPRKIWQVIGASSAGTVIEWYDFYIFGALATIISPKFYPAGNDTFALIAYLSTFAVGFVVRPFGAIFFGRIGDLVGRKYAFLVTLLVMGGATAAVGILPTYETIGVAAPIALLTIRVLQGLALGGEYGGAAVYVAEHVPDKKRGFYTSFIQITATLGLFISLMVVLLLQTVMSDADFKNWGWRLPFLLSIILVGMSLFIRLKMKESPIFAHLKSQGKTSTAPLKDAFTQKENLKRMAISLFGATAGQGVVWYTGQFYALFYMQTILKIETKKAAIIVAVALVLAMPFFVVVGALSDRIGRKKLMMAGCLIAALSYLPIYRMMRAAAGNNITGVGSTKNPVTGEIKVAPETLVDGVATAFTGVAQNPNVPALIRARLHPGALRHDGLRADRGVPGRGVPGEGPLHVHVAAVPHRKRHLRRPAAGDRPVRRGCHGSIYAGLYYPIAVVADHVRRGQPAAEETSTRRSGRLRRWKEISHYAADQVTYAEEGRGQARWRRGARRSASRRGTNTGPRRAGAQAPALLRTSTRYGVRAEQQREACAGARRSGPPRQEQREHQYFASTSTGRAAGQRGTRTS